MNDTKRIAVLITCYNRRETTLKCLRALFGQALPDDVVCETYLVDDGCTDGTGEAVQKQFPDVNILKGDGNLFWCGGMRKAWSEAMKDNYDAYLWLNDDAILLPGALRTLLVTARDIRLKEGRDGIIVGSCYDPETGRHTYGGRIRRNRGGRIPDKPLLPSNQVLHSDTMNGNVVLVPRQVAAVLGNISSEYTHAFGDVDYGMRAREYGIPILVAPGYLAECAANMRVPPWTDMRVSLKERWKNMCSPRGLPPKQWYVYVRRHTGMAWPIYCLKIYIRVLFPRFWEWLKNQSALEGAKRKS